MTPAKKWFFGALGVVFLLAISAHLGAWLSRPKEAPRPTERPGPLRALTDLKADGWAVEAMPIGDTEVVREVVLSTLRYDDYIYLRFRKAGREFWIYVAYWAPGKTTAREVRHHTPDTCWELSGWVPLQRAERQIVCGEQLSAEGQFRRYTANGQVQEVVFWHFMNGALVPHWRYGQPTLKQVIESITGDPNAVRGEQYFLRVSAPDTIDWLWSEPAWQEITRILAAIGLTK